MLKSEQSKVGLWFFLVSLVIFLIVSYLNPLKFKPMLLVFTSLLKNIVWIFVLVFGLMFITNYFINQKKLSKLMGHKTGIKGWLITVFGGILSSGPIYMWYPLLSDLQEKGVSKGHIATFLYNRSIKIPLLPLIVSYFGIIFTVVLTFVMIIFSVLQGLIINKLILIKK